MTYLSEGWEKRVATVHYPDGDYYLHLGIVKVTDAEPEDAETGTVPGVDLNVDASLAVTSSGSFIGHADFLARASRV